MIMKKFTALLMSFLLVFSLAACGNTPQAEEAESTANPETIADDVIPDAEEDSSEEVTDADDASTKDAEEDSEAAGSKVLVVYYSATGSTEAVAETIADATGGDLFELVPVEPYSSEDLDWTNSNSRVSVEYANEEQRVVELIADSVENWDEYDTVLIGYPIWWGIAAWPVNEFVENNDFSDKTVIPFCTSSSSGLGQSGELLEEMAGTGDWQEGMRFRSSVSSDDVRAWVEGLEL